MQKWFSDNGHCLLGINPEYFLDPSTMRTTTRIAAHSIVDCNPLGRGGHPTERLRTKTAGLDNLTALTKRMRDNHMPQSCDMQIYPTASG